MAKELTPLEAELLEALRPFHDLCVAIDSRATGIAADDEKIIHPGLTVGHFRKALAAIARAEYEEDR